MEETLNNTRRAKERNKFDRYSRWTFYYILGGLELIFRGLELLCKIPKMLFNIVGNIFGNIVEALAIPLYIAALFAALLSLPTVWLYWMVDLYHKNTWFGFFIAGGLATWASSLLYLVVLLLLGGLYSYLFSYVVIEKRGSDIFELYSDEPDLSKNANDDEPSWIKQIKSNWFAPIVSLSYVPIVGGIVIFFIQLISFGIVKF